MKTFKPCLAEFIGTFYLCFPGIAERGRNVKIGGFGIGRTPKGIS